MSIEGLTFCFGITAAGTAAAAALGGLRLADLIVTGAVMVGIVVLAIRDSRWLAVAVVGTWIWAPLVRRVVDWQSGGYVSVTALSLLPMFATSALVVPLWPRLKRVPAELVQPLVLLAAPVVVASVIGLLSYGPSSVVEAGLWLLPLLFVPYLATRPADGLGPFWLIRATVVVAAVSAAYGVYQFFAPPTWDLLWLVQSNMTTSMGRAEAMQMRIWGPMNATGTAAVVWAMALLMVFADRRWWPAARAGAALVLAVALALTLVRIGWIMLVGGVIVYLVVRGGRDAMVLAASFLIGLAILGLVLAMLPGGERVIDRAASFGNLSEDNSYNTRTDLTAQFYRQIMDKPWGWGMGFKTASKVAGTSAMIDVIDNGYLDIFLTLSIPGGLIFLGGLFGLCVRHLRARAGARDGAWGQERRSVACVGVTLVCVLLVSNIAAFAFAGVAGVLCWMAIGLADVRPDAAELPSPRRRHWRPSVRGL